MPYFHKPSQQSLELIGGIGNDLFFECSEEEHILFMQMGILFLRNVMGEPPVGSELKVVLISNNHCFERMIVLAFDIEPEGAEVYALKCEKALPVFAEAVDWKAIRRDVMRPFIAAQKVDTLEDMLTWLRTDTDDAM